MLPVLEGESYLELKTGLRGEEGGWSQFFLRGTLD